MKGVVFVEFLELLDDLLGIEGSERLIESSNLPSKGEYTTVGTYDDSEMYTLVGQLHEKTQIPVPKLLKIFGKFLFTKFSIRYKSMMDGINDGFSLLKRTDNYIHVEVQKLYPEAILPSFEYEELNENTLKLIYKSSRKMPDLAEGLIEACMEHFKEDAIINRKIIKPDNSWVEFTITKT